jgi:hypothetical protein
MLVVVAKSFITFAFSVFTNISLMLRITWFINQMTLATFNIYKVNRSSQFCSPLANRSGCTTASRQLLV